MDEIFNGLIDSGFRSSAFMKSYDFVKGILAPRQAVGNMKERTSPEDLSFQPEMDRKLSNRQATADS